MKKILLFLCSLTVMVGGQIPIAASGIANQEIGTELEQAIDTESEQTFDESVYENDEAVVEEEMTAEQTQNETDEEAANVEVELETLAIGTNINNGSYQFYMNPNGTIKYASVTENGRVTQTLQYYDGTRMSDVQGNKENRLNYRAHLRADGTVDHVRGYRLNGEWFEVLEYPANTKLNQNNPYWFQRTKTFVLVPGRRDGLIGHATTFTAPKVPQVAAQSMFYAGAKYGENHMQELRYEAHLTPDWTVKYVSVGENGRIVRQQQYHPGTKYGQIVSNIDNRAQFSAYLNENGTVNHTREYDVNGNWIKAFEYASSDMRLNQNRPYWHFRTVTHYMVANRKDGVIHYTTEFKAPTPKTARTNIQYYPNTRYGQGHEQKVKYRAYVNADDTFNQVRGYREDGTWFEVLEHPQGTKINHNEEYWNGREFTFYLAPGRTDGLLLRATRWDRWQHRNSVRAVREYVAQPNTYYGQEHWKRWASQTQVATPTPAPAPKPAPKPQPEAPKWVWPVNSWTISTNYLRDPAPCNSSSGGPNCYPHSINGGRHYGLDIAAPTGTHVWAASEGDIIASGRDGSRGNYIIIRHADNVYSNYYHLSGFQRRSGWVATGELIGYVGETGQAYGPHLHFQMGRGGSSNDKSINPAEYIPGMKWNYSMNIIDMIIAQEEKRRREMPFAKNDFLV